jgi:fructoselysine and glucoselysine-specific PTS system IIB component
MINLLRVDHRLLHGQVAFSWLKALNSDCVLIASDELMQDKIRFAALKMAKPSGVKLVIKNVQDAIQALNNGVTDKYNLFIVVESIEIAYQLVKNVEDLNYINLGGMKNGADRKQISKAVHVSTHDIELLEELRNEGVKMEVQLVPDDQAQDVFNLIK